MCHSGCYGPLPGSGHRTLTGACHWTAAQAGVPLPSLNRTLGHHSTVTWRQEDERFFFSGSQLGFSSRFQNDTPRQTLSPGGKPSPSPSLPPRGQPSSLSSGVDQTPATSCQGLMLHLLNNRHILGGGGRRAREHRLVNSTDNANPLLQRLLSEVAEG